MENPSNLIFRLNSLETNPSNLSFYKDWEFSVSFAGEQADKIYGNVYSFSAAKRIGIHRLYFRYSPGFQKEFVFFTGESILGVNMEKTFKYKESFGFGYSVEIYKGFGAGFSARYFTQTFEQDFPEPVFTDSINYILTRTVTEKRNFLRGDAGLFYHKDDIIITASSINMFNVWQIEDSHEVEEVNINNEKDILLAVYWNPLSSYSLQALYETSNSFSLGLNKSFKFLTGSLTLGVTALSLKDQEPFISSVIPGINFSSGFYSLSLHAVKYFSQRETAASYNEFAENGITNLISNRFTYDRAVLTFNIALSPSAEKTVKIINAKILNNIYPAFGDFYAYNPFAEIKAVNISDKRISVKSYCAIEGVVKENMQTGEFYINPADTAVIPIFAVPDKSSKVKTQSTVRNVSFKISAGDNSEPEEIQKPVYVYGANSWDGDVAKLKYFVFEEMDFSRNLAKDAVQNYVSGDSSGRLDLFYKAAKIFDRTIAKMSYERDPRIQTDVVQYPSETVNIKGGDCEDLSVLYSSLLESVGIQTAFVDYNNYPGINHVNVIFNTELSPEEAALITNNDMKYIIRKGESGKDEVWIPVETTSFSGFETAWNQAAELYNEKAVINLGAAKGTVKIIDVY